MPAPSDIERLVEQFAKHHDSYNSPSYKEESLKREFLEPFFTALGWDIGNSKGLPESYKEVVFEETIRREEDDAPKAPDYSFSFGGKRKFFVEAKKPSVTIKQNRPAALQLRRYAWSVKLPISILTNFEEFAVYNCLIEPEKSQQPDTALLFRMGYDEYLSRWNEIACWFSYDAVRNGALDRFTATLSAEGSKEVDARFVETIEEWRKLLAQDIANRNDTGGKKEVREDRIKYAVGKIIDRIIFLRVCEGRGLEPEKRLMVVSGGVNRYSKLVEYFRAADKRYNSGLFHFRARPDRVEAPDIVTPTLEVGNDTIHYVLRGLYDDICPYDFHALSVDILGLIYEQFLGKVIVLQSNGRVDVDLKPEVKRAGGICYTPPFVVDYIVQHTLKPLLESKTPSTIGTFRVLDPACGSGSFLIRAYQSLLSWYLDNYVSEYKSAGPKPPSGLLSHLPIYSTSGGNWQLTLDERIEILRRHVFGVDLDEQAVEVTKLSLLLEVLRTESKDAIDKLVQTGKSALPDIGSNIRRGNSLISTDYDGDESVYKTQAFNWREAFEEIMGSGGFDVVIGNPPYVRQETLGASFKNYVKTRYATYHGVADLYAYFIERAHWLLRDGGSFGMICSNKWMRSNYGGPLRSYLAQNATLRQIVDFGELRVFQNAATFPAILLTEKRPCTRQRFVYAPIKRLPLPSSSLEDEVKQIGQTLGEAAITGKNWALTGAKESTILEKIRRNGTPLGDYAGTQILRGVVTGLNEAFIIDRTTRDTLIAADPRCKNLLKPLVIGDDIRRYRIQSKDKYLIFTRHGTDINRFPAIKTHLSRYKKRLEPKPVNFSGDSWPGRKPGPYKWWEIQDNVAYYKEFDKPKIVMPDIAKESRMAFDSRGLYLANTCYFIPSDDLYLLAVLNSRLIFSYFKRTAAVLGDADKGGRLRWFRQDVVKLPIRRIDKSNKKDKGRHDELVRLVRRMLKLNEEFMAAFMDAQQEPLERQIRAADEEIDRIVYELYGLSDEEIRIVKGESA